MSKVSLSKRLSFFFEKLSKKNFNKIVKSECFWFVLIITLGIFLRFYKLGVLPPGFTGDEAWLGIDGERVAQEGWIGLYIPGHAFGYNSLHAYIAGALIKSLGLSIVSTRLSAVFPGVLSLIFFYFLSRIFYPPKVSLIILGLLVVSRWHIHFSRLALPGIILMPLFSSASFLFIFKAIKTNRVLFFALAGVFLGLGINSYFFFASTLVTALIFLIIKSLSQRKLLKNIVILCLVTALITAPFGLFLLKNPDMVSGKWQFRSIFNPQNQIGFNISAKNQRIANVKVLVIQIEKTLGGLFSRGDTDAINNPPGVPLLERSLAVLFLVGLILSLLKVKKEMNYFFVIWLIFSLMVGVLTESAPNSKRTLDAVFPTFLFIGNCFFFLEKKLPKKLFYIAGLTVFVSSFLINYKIYFRDYARNYEVRKRFAFEIVQMCSFFNQRKISPYIYFYHPATYFNYESRRSLCGNLVGEDRSREFGKFSLESNQKGPIAFVYFDSYRVIANNLSKIYQTGKIQEFYDENQNFIWGTYLIEKR